MLDELARQAGPAVRAEALTADLLDSRQRLVTAREEERRRLRRDLHDGLGPMLTGVGLNLDAGRSGPGWPPTAGSGERPADVFLAAAKDGVHAGDRRPAGPRLRPAPAGAGRPRADRCGHRARRAAGRRRAGRSTRPGCRSCRPRSRWPRCGPRSRRSTTPSGTAAPGTARYGWPPAGRTAPRGDRRRPVERPWRPGRRADRDAGAGRRAGRVAEAGPDRGRRPGRRPLPAGGAE